MNCVKLDAHPAHIARGKRWKIRGLSIYRLNFLHVLLQWLVDGGATQSMDYFNQFEGTVDDDVKDSVHRNVLAMFTLAGPSLRYMTLMLGNVPMPAMDFSPNLNLHHLNLPYMELDPITHTLSVLPPCTVTTIGLYISKLQHADTLGHLDHLDTILTSPQFDSLINLTITMELGYWNSMTGQTGEQSKMADFRQELPRRLHRLRTMSERGIIVVRVFVRKERAGKERVTF